MITAVWSEYIIMNSFLCSTMNNSRYYKLISHPVNGDNLEKYSKAIDIDDAPISI